MRKWSYSMQNFSLSSNNPTFVIFSFDFIVEKFEKLFWREKFFEFFCFKTTLLGKTIIMEHIRTLLKFVGAKPPCHFALPVFTGFLYL